MLLSLKRIFDSLQPVLLIASAVLVIVGIKLAGDTLTMPWVHTNYYALGIWLAFSVTSLLLVRIIIPQYAPLLAPACVLALLLIGSGIISSLVCLLFLFSIYATGKLILKWLFNTEKQPDSWQQTLIIGFSAYVFIIGLLIHFPINYPITYLFVLATPIIAITYQKKLRTELLGEFKNKTSYLNSNLSKVSYWKLSCLLVIIGFPGVYTFLPSITSDDNSYHLAMWTQLSTQHQFLFDVKTQIWYAAPFTLDMIHGFISVISMMDARGSLNIILLLFLVLAVLDVSTSIIKNQTCILFTLALFVSTPLVTNLLLGLQTEMLLALLTTVGAGVILNPKIQFIKKFILIFLICCILVSIKLPAILIAASLVISLFISEWKNVKEHRELSKNSWIKLLFVGFIGCAIALHTYINAYYVTGNPVFPLYNGIFKSPFYYPTNFKDDTFSHGASLSAYLGFFFNSSKYFESYNFIAGFQYLILPLFGAFYLLINKKYTALFILAFPIMLYGGTIFYLMQYWRYLFPILPLACILAAAAFTSFTGSTQKSYRQGISVGIFIFYIYLNLHYLPSVSWLLKNNPFENLTQEAKLSTMQAYCSEAALNHYMNTNHPGESVLFEMDRSSGATLRAKPYYIAWISPSTLADFDQMKNSADFLAYLKKNKIRFIYRHELPIANSFYFRDFIKEVIDQYGTKEMVSGNVGLYKINY